MKNTILTINAGSSSIKFALFRDNEVPSQLIRGKIDRIGLPGAVLEYIDETGVLTRNEIPVSDTEEAISILHSFLDEHIDFDRLSAVGHRIVHGMNREAHALVTEGLIAELKEIKTIDQEHLPLEISLMENFQKSYPQLMQVACFDTVFHHNLPAVSRLLPLPRRFEEMGVRRYGFHGLSLAYVMEELKRIDPAKADGKVIVLHLGSGVSVTAIEDGKSTDTSMGFTPTGGMLMGSRSGDLDPGALWYVMKNENLSLDDMSRMVNKESGLIGVSETSSDMYDLLQIESTDSRAKEAIALFCYEAKKRIGSYAVALGGVETIIFTGGMGEKAPLIRARITEGLEFLGVLLDESRNQAGDGVISAVSSTVCVRVMHINEELMIAKITKEFTNK